MRIYLFIAAIAGGVTYLITPLIRHIAIEIGAVGEVRARDVHTIPTPRLGGLGMLIGFTVSMLFASVHSRIVRAIATGVGDSRWRHYDQSAWHGRRLVGS